MIPSSQVWINSFNTIQSDYNEFYFQKIYLDFSHQN